jgi:hypothetical protein
MFLGDAAQRTTQVSRLYFGRTRRYTGRFMWTGKHFRLKREILAVTISDGPRRADYIPEGETVHVIGGPRQDDMRLVDIQWGGNEFSVFLVDLKSRGEEVNVTGA